MGPHEVALLDRRFHALADPTRRRLWLALGTSPGATTADLVALLPQMSRWAVMKHLAVLRGSGLVLTLPEGRRRRHYRDEHGLEPLLAWIGRSAG